jgi:hypothetical protein
LPGTGFVGRVLCPLLRKLSSTKQRHRYPWVQFRRRIALPVFELFTQEFKDVDIRLVFYE